MCIYFCHITRIVYYYHFFLHISLHAWTGKEMLSRLIINTCEISCIRYVSPYTCARSTSRQDGFTCDRSRFIREGTEKCVLLFVYFLKKTIFDKMLFSHRSRFQIRKHRTTAVLCFRIDNNIIIAAVGDRANSHSRLLYTFYNTHRAAPRVYV